MNMPSVFTASTKVTILFLGWTTSSTLSYLFTLIFLFLLAITNRFLAALKSQLERSWNRPSQSAVPTLQPAPRRARPAKDRQSPLPKYMEMSPGEGIEDNTCPRDTDLKEEDNPTSGLLGRAKIGSLRRKIGPWHANRSWRLYQDGISSVLELCKAVIGMLSVMTLNIGVFCAVLTGILVVQAKGPFLHKLNETTHIIGNDLWNVTIGHQYGVKLFYRETDLVGNAWGYYVSYNGAQSNLNWTSASIHHRGTNYADIKLTAAEGDFHWVIFNHLAGAYQTSEYASSTKVQDETWQREDGSYITKYDFSAYIRDLDFYGVYGDQFGSWYINPGKDYYNGNHLKQELTVHRESATGDAVQLNMIHKAHFQTSSVDNIPDGKLLGPWLWYMNNGSKSDAAEQTKQEFQSWPYKLFQDKSYHSHGSVSNNLILSDALDMGSDYYYTGKTDNQGSFTFRHVRCGKYSLQAWSDGGRIADVTASFHDGVSVQQKKQTQLGRLEWKISSRKKIFHIGGFDQKSLGFKHGGNPYQHALVEKCPANLTYTFGESKTSDWCFTQSAKGSWTIHFTVDEKTIKKPALLTVSWRDTPPERHLRSYLMETQIVRLETLPRY
ncbi:putative rhamnogalacturonase [Aspergillus tanneri]|uniref:Rhamnogalacturonan endolyase n=1 Tax=Aspergillus tanneri TaxID=1220188 RepID=A0A5M9MS10_9EURO|nr:uncharacterized protein ATNIH1004_006766 [Aspergillus tanneri]KAA8645347.1 hypothetical protein ATNIH1004_006766 [Aspergillus tanneri]